VGGSWLICIQSLERNIHILKVSDDGARGNTCMIKSKGKA
jgi:hypothetical protein